MPDEAPLGTEATPTTIETTPIPGTGSEPGQTPETKTLLSTELDKEAPKAPEGAPEKYEDWKVPEGYTLDAKAAEAATPLFKELGLSQAQAQKLVDFYSTNMLDSAKASDEAFKATRAEWVESLKSHPVIGKAIESGKLKTSINSALDTIGDPTLVKDFKDVMDQSGMGDNPAFVRVMYALANKLTEGTFVQGQPLNSGKARPSAAAAIFPNLPSGQG